MNIFLSEEDLSQMPPALRDRLLRWQMTRVSAHEHTRVRQQSSGRKQTAYQLSLLPELKDRISQPQLNQLQAQANKPESLARVTFTQLYDAGITKPGMPVRVRLKRELAKKLSRDYINGMEISARGSIIFQGQEYDKPTPLATKINGRAADGYYVEVKKDGKWIRFKQLAEISRHLSA